GAGHFNRVPHDVQRAAALEAGTVGLVDEVHADLDGEARIGTDAQEVDMQRLVRNRIELVVARDDPVLLAIDVERDDTGEEAARIDALHRFLEGERDGDGGLLVAIDDSRDESLTTHSAS